MPCILMLFGLMVPEPFATAVVVVARATRVFVMSGDTVLSLRMALMRVEGPPATGESGMLVGAMVKIDSEPEARDVGGSP